VTVRTKRGFARLEWQKLRERNEALDCRVYARAAAWIAGADRWSDEKWRDLEDQLGAAPTETMARGRSTGRNPTPGPGSSDWLGRTRRMVLMTDWTETELSALRRAYASGTTRVSYDGKSVDYGSAEDLLARIRTIERAIAGTTRPLPVAGLAGFKPRGSLMSANWIDHAIATVAPAHGRPSRAGAAGLRDPDARL
jgi:hypothetical protein